MLQRIYVTLYPCNECAKLLIQAGIKEVIFHEVGETANCAGLLAQHRDASDSPNNDLLGRHCVMWKAA